MSKNKYPLKLKVNPWRIVLVFILSYIALEIIFYLSLTPWYTLDFNPFNKVPFYIYTPALIVVTIVFMVLSIKNTYYEIDGTKLCHYKMGHCDEYPYANIVYIDEEWSKKHKMLHFYMKSGKSHTLAFDKEGLIFKFAVEKSNQMSREEFRAKYPNAKM